MGGDPKAGQPSARTVLSQPPWHAWWSGVLDEHTAFHPFRRLVSGSVNTDFCDGGLILKGSPRSVSSKYSHPFSFNAVIFVEWNVNGVRVTFVASFQQGRKPPTFLFNFAVWSRLIKKRVRDTHINVSKSPFCYRNGQKAKAKSELNSFPQGPALVVRGGELLAHARRLGVEVVDAIKLILQPHLQQRG